MNDMLRKFTVEDKFFGYYEKLVKDKVVPYQEKVLNDEIEDVEKSHAIENFRIAAKLMETGKCEEEFYGMVFQDSDVAKWIEATAYTLMRYPNKELESRCDKVIDLIGRAQHGDGYLNTYFTVKAPGKQWTNLGEAHELYCAGHMIEAAVAYAECTGKTTLLDIMCRMADHIYLRFIEEHEPGYPGHPEVELALMRLYRYTKEEKYKTLAEHFINVRGVDSDFFIQEREKYKWTVWGNDHSDKEYAQNHMPVRQQTKATGHAVRAVYLYTGMADVAQETSDNSLIEACKTLWNNITDCKMYITGAIGSSYEGEAFTKDYHLPNDTAYAETCASIGLIFFARKMIDIEKNSIYADTIERALYNCVLAGMELDGTKFFYVNPLEVIPGISGEAATHKHSLPCRPKWFACACCPPNVARLVSSLGRYVWSEEKNTVYSHLFIGGILDVTDSLGGRIRVETGYPYEDTVKYKFETANQSMAITLAIRLPYWSEKTDISLNGISINYDVKNGYAYIKRDFLDKDVVELKFDMSIKRIFASPKVAAESGKVAFMRGPLVYCAEGVDNNEDVLSLFVKSNGKAEIIKSDKLNGIIEIKIDGYKVHNTKKLYSSDRPKMDDYKITLIPYYAWGNRGLNQMRVWIPEK